MCWKYEEEYAFCTDSLLQEWGRIKYGYVASLLDYFERNLQLKITDVDVFEDAFLEFLSVMHEKKIIVPDNGFKKNVVDLSLALGESQFIIGSVIKENSKNKEIEKELKIMKNSLIEYDKKLMEFFKDELKTEE